MSSSQVVIVFPVVFALLLTGCSPESFIVGPLDIDPTEQAWAVGTRLSVHPGTRGRLRRPELTIESTDEGGPIVGVGEMDGVGMILREGTFDVVSKTMSGKEIARVSLESKAVESYRLGLLFTRGMFPDVVFSEVPLILDGGWVSLRPVPMSAAGQPLFGKFPIGVSSPDFETSLNGEMGVHEEINLEAAGVGRGGLRVDVESNWIDFEIEVVAPDVIVDLEVVSLPDKQDPDKYTNFYVTGRSEGGRSVYGVQATWPGGLQEHYYRAERGESGEVCLGEICAPWSAQDR